MCCSHTGCRVEPEGGLAGRARQRCQAGAVRGAVDEGWGKAQTCGVGGTILSAAVFTYIHLFNQQLSKACRVPGTARVLGVAVTLSSFLSQTLETFQISVSKWFFLLVNTAYASAVVKSTNPLSLRGELNV